MVEAAKKEITIKVGPNDIKISTYSKTKGAKKVSIRISREEAKELCDKLAAVRYQGCFSEASQSIDPFDLLFVERDV